MNDSYTAFQTLDNNLKNSYRKCIYILLTSLRQTLYTENKSQKTCDLIYGSRVNMLSILNIIWALRTVQNVYNQASRCHDRSTTTVLYRGVQCTILAAPVPYILFIPR